MTRVKLRQKKELLANQCKRSFLDEMSKMEGSKTMGSTCNRYSKGKYKEAGAAKQILDIAQGSFINLMETTRGA